jgi:antirestriction protein ArdC
LKDSPSCNYGRPEPVADPVERIAHADRFFANTGAVIRHGGSQAFYQPSSDIIQLPSFKAFRDAASYYAVLGHESVHYAVSWIMPHGRVWRP